MLTLTNSVAASSKIEILDRFISLLRPFASSISIVDASTPVAVADCLNRRQQRPKNPMMAITARLNERKRTQFNWSAIGHGLPSVWNGQDNEPALGLHIQRGTRRPSKQSIAAGRNSLPARLLLAAQHSAAGEEHGSHQQRCRLGYARRRRRYHRPPALGRSFPSRRRSRRSKRSRYWRDRGSAKRNSSPNCCADRVVGCIDDVIVVVVA